MANYTTTANVVLHVNGKQAKQMFGDLQKKAEDLSKRIDEAARSGDKVTMKKLQRELRQTENIMKQIQGTSQNVENTLNALDKASPKQLKAALKDLEKSLNNIERGSEAWNTQVEKIKAVRAELQRVNASMREQESGWNRMSRWLNDTQTFLMGAAAAATGLVMAARSAVNEYAEMEQEMANVRKFTGMEADGVEHLNEAFRKMDTRTARDQLNVLAQEAGRLGKQTEAEVLGYVRAADKINVSLDDLGKGATLTLSKLTGIFGVEDQLGTERSLLAVGSVINELSQNCSASAPYLAQFSSRMGGVAAQAGMTVQQVMALAAVLDTTNQGVEAASTAVSQVITRLFQDPAKYARVAGLEVKAFSELLRNDTNEALLTLLETLHNAGGMETLAPMFKDMGENGARAIAALSSLAEHIGDVRKQQEVANVAFREATSIDKEFEVQNTTVLALMEKSRKSLSELAISLGQQLQPAMKYVYSSSSIMLHTLSELVNFFLKNRTAIISLTAAVVAYTAVVKISAARTSILTAAQSAAAAGAVKLRAALNAIKANPIALVVSALTALGVAVYNSVSKMSELRREMDKAMESATSFAEETNREKRELDKLFGAIEGARKGTKEYEDARNSIISKYGIYLKGLIDERGEITNLALAYDRLSFAARESAKARSIAKARESLDDAYYSGIDSMTERLRKALEKMEMPVNDITRIVTQVSQAFAAGESLPEGLSHEIYAYQHQNMGLWQNVFGDKPSEIIQQLYTAQRDYNTRSGKLDSMQTRQLSEVVTSELDESIKSIADQLADPKLGNIEVAVSVSGDDAAKKLTQTISQGVKVPQTNTQTIQPATAANALLPTGSLPVNPLTLPQSKQPEKLPELTYSYFPMKDGGKATGILTRSQAENLLRELMFERSQRSDSPAAEHQKKFGAPELDLGSDSAAKNADRFAAEKEWREREEALARISYATGESDYLQYTDRMNEIAVEFYKRQLDHTDLSENERLSITASYQEALAKQSREASKRTLDEENAAYNERMAELKQFYIDGQISHEAYSQKSEELEIEHQRNLVNISKEGSSERLAAESRLQDLLLAQTQRRQRETEQLEKQYAEIKKQYFGLNPQERETAMNTELAAIQVVYEREIAAAQDNADEKLRIEEAFQQAKQAIRERYQEESAESEVSALDTVQRSASAMISGMSSIFSQLTSYMQSELEIQTAVINKRYDAEISRAEGNSYKVQKLEKQKEKEIAKAKNDANRKMFAMQVIQAVAQTATNALAAYGSAAAIPVVGYVLAPIAAAMAVAAGMIQVAAIKKQQQASESQGYSEGGFTPKGRRDEPVGIVHAGEWVASQRLVNNPRVRPVLEALDYAQRTNTVGSLSAGDVSRSITAPMLLAQGQQPQTITVAAPPASVVVNDNPEYVSVMRRLADRLDEPFVTVNTVSGDHGIRRALDQYDTMISNKSPKSKKK